jgi:hypothetical protein
MDLPIFSHVVRILFARERAVVVWRCIRIGDYWYGSHRLARGLPCYGGLMLDNIYQAINDPRSC